MRGGKLSSVQKFALKDSKWKYLQKGKQSNLSIFEILTNGCFDTDWKSYCVNRINGFSCSFWLELDEIGNYGFVDDSNDTLQISSATNALDSSSFCESSSIDPGYLPGGFILKFIISTLVLIVIMSNLLTLLNMRRLAHIYLPICHYFTYICVFDQIDCLILSTDWLFSIFTKFQPLQILQLISQSSCQMIPMLFSICRHLTSGLIIGIAIDLLRFIKSPVGFLAGYRSEWVKNVFIMCTVLVCTINCQFFWTFDLNHGENKPLNGRIISNYLECDFSNTLPLNAMFTQFIWPIADHSLSELLPFVSALISIVFSSYLLYKKFPEKYSINLNKVLINAPLVLHLTKCLIGFLLVNVMLNLLPRIIYFAIKIFLHRYTYGFSSIRLSNSNSFHQNWPPIGRQMSDNYLYLVSFGKFIKYQPLFNVVIRYVYFCIFMQEFRTNSWEFVSIFNVRKVFSKRIINSSMTMEKLFTNSSNNPEIMELDKQTDEKRKSLLVEIYC